MNSGIEKMSYLDAIAVSKLMSLKGVGRSLAGKVICDLAQRNTRIHDGLRLPEFEEILARWLSVEQIDHLKIIDERIQKQIEELVSHEGAAVTIADEEYPRLLSRYLNSQTPPILFYFGNLSLLHKPSVGFCGSRNASEKGLSTASDCAAHLASNGIVIVSGYAAGIDQAAHLSALEANGETIIVLAEGILRFRIKRQFEENWNWDKVLVLSEFPLGVPWTSRQAMQRNKTIVGLSDVMIVVEAALNGGTMAAAEDTLEMGKPLFTPVYEGEGDFALGNKLLLNRGASRLMKSKRSGQPILDSLVDKVFQERMVGDSQGTLDIL